MRNSYIPEILGLKLSWRSPRVWVNSHDAGLKLMPVQPLSGDRSVSGLAPPRLVN
jgi:hypothetical protein